MEEVLMEICGGEEVDFDYEYDAAKFYDFTRPETVFEAYEAERWFETARSYPPSPIAIKLNWEPSVPAKAGKSSFVCRVVHNNNGTSSVDMSSSLDSELTSVGSESCGQAKSPLSKHSNFMNPTASQLAKQKHLPQIHCDRVLRRSQKSVKNEGKSLQNCSAAGNQATKRQKLEVGYLCKVARLKHQANFLHKEPKKAGLADVHTTFTKPKVTIPKEPNLETAFRAERYRAKINLEAVETQNSNACAFRARPLNRKILEAPLFPFPKKSTRHLPEFQEFHLRTSERAMQHQFTNEANAPSCRSSAQNETTSSVRVIPIAGLKKKSEGFDGIKACCLDKKEYNFQADKRFPAEPPIESFTKLSLNSEADSSPKSLTKLSLHSKGLKENTLGSSPLEKEMKNVAKPSRLGGSNFQCGSDRKMPSLVPQINRSLDMR